MEKSSESREDLQLQDAAAPWCRPRLTKYANVPGIRAKISIYIYIYVCVYQFIQMFLVFPLQLSVEMRNRENSWFQGFQVPGTGRNVRETVSAPLLLR